MTTETIRRGLVRVGFDDDILVHEERSHPGGGARRTTEIRVTAPDGPDGGIRYVVRRPRADRDVAAVTLRQEFELLRALRGHGVAVPEPLWCFDETVSSTSPFFVTEYVPGWTPDVWDRSDRRRLYRAWESRRSGCPTEFVQSLANTHSVPVEAVPELGTETASTLVDSQLDHWRARYDSGRLPTEPVVSEAMQWLRKHRPDVPTRTLVHGDFRAGNLRFHRGDVTVLDWEIARIADPMYDLGFTSVSYYAGGGPDQVTRPALASALVDREWLYTEYGKRVDHDVDRDRIHYWRLFCVFLLAVHRLAAASSQSGPDETGPKTRDLARSHVAELERLL